VILCDICGHDIVKWAISAVNVTISPNRYEHYFYDSICMSGFYTKKTNLILRVVNFIKL